MPYFASKIFRISQDFQTRKVDFQGWTQLVEGHISKTTALNGPILASLALSGRALQNGMSGSENGRRGVALNKKHRYSLNYGSICKSLPDLRPCFFTFLSKILKIFRPPKKNFFGPQKFQKWEEKVRNFSCKIRHLKNHLSLLKGRTRVFMFSSVVRGRGELKIGSFFSRVEMSIFPQFQPI